MKDYSLTVEVHYDITEGSEDNEESDEEDEPYVIRRDQIAWVEETEEMAVM